MERDIPHNTGDETKFISTHTLTWSVTSGNIITYTDNGISTHTLTWSVTIAALGVAEVVEISTHTLTWSVTIELNADSVSGSDFNSHAHVERDDNIKFCRIAQIYFNSHAHVERDIQVIS